jgi:Ca2+-binding RTX toxin-like protein
MSGRKVVSAAAVLAAAVAVTTSASGSPSSPLAANGRIAFSDVTGIGSMNPDGSGQWGVELNVGDTQPAWSSDGTQLAVVTHWAGRYGILVMAPDGSGARLITTDPQDAEPAWSPDGKRIALSNQGHLYLVDADRSHRTELTHGPNWDWHPTWSPDGKAIAFSRSREAGADIYSIEIATGIETRLTSDDGGSYSPAWSPDGSQIAFSGYRDGQSHLLLVNADGSGEKTLTEGSYDSLPAWSPDGTRIAFDRNGQVWVVARDGSGAQQLTSGDGSSYPAWQPLGPPPPGCTLWGTATNDLLVGSEGRDVLCGLDGNDTIIGLGGDDVVYGGAGNDSIAGGLGFDQMDGGPGNDHIDAADGGADRIAGGDGEDFAVVDGRADTRFDVESSRVSRNLASWRPVTASAFEPTNPPVRAVDGVAGDWWNSGGYPSQWIQVDLQRAADLARVRIVAPELPKGALYMVLGKGPQTHGVYKLLHTFRGPTVYLQELSFSPKHPWQRIRYLRIVTPVVNAPVGWVALPELEVYAAGKRR